MEKKLDSLYDNKLRIEDLRVLKQAETDIVTTKIKMVFRDKPFMPTVLYFTDLHKFLFEDIYYFAGKIRKTKMYKEEALLNRLSVDYSSPEEIIPNLEYVFDRLKSTNTLEMNDQELTVFVSDVLVDLWKTHPFREGNTRTCLVFLRLLLHSYGIHFNEDFFKNKNTYDYMRSALVAASFEAEDMNIKRNYSYVHRIIGDIISDERKRFAGR